MSDLVDRDRPVRPAPTRLSRVRCTHCHMPAGAAHARCWSCGLDPTGPADTAGQPEASARRSTNLPPPWHAVLLVVAAATLVLVALLGTVMMLSSEEDGRGPRGIAARLNGDAWVRAGAGGATIEFPSRPVRSTAPPVPGRTGPVEILVASAPGLRVELQAAPLEGSLSPADLVETYGAATGQEVRRSASVTVRGAPGLDALLESPEGITRVRAVVTASTAYLLVVTGPAAAFQRVATSLSPAS